MTEQERQHVEEWHSTNDEEEPGCDWESDCPLLAVEDK